MKAIRKITLTASLISFSIFGFAQQAVPVNNLNQLEFGMVGKLNNSPLFQLKANNNDQAKYYVIVKVKDAAGTVFYTETLTGKNISRKYQLDLSDADAADQLNIKFEIISSDSKQPFIYNVTRNSLHRNSLVVAKL
jgi:hypothetical protein